MTINRFSVLGQWAQERFVGMRHLLVTGKDDVYHHTAVWIFISPALK